MSIFENLYLCFIDICTVCFGCEHLRNERLARTVANGQNRIVSVNARYRIRQDKRRRTGNIIPCFSSAVIRVERRTIDCFAGDCYIPYRVVRHRRGRNIRRGLDMDCERRFAAVSRTAERELCVPRYAGDNLAVYPIRHGGAADVNRVLRSIRFHIIYEYFKVGIHRFLRQSKFIAAQAYRKRPPVLLRCKGYRVCDCKSGDIRHSGREFYHVLGAVLKRRTRRQRDAVDIERVKADCFFNRLHCHCIFQRDRFIRECVRIYVVVEVYHNGVVDQHIVGIFFYLRSEAPWVVDMDVVGINLITVSHRAAVTAFISELGCTVENSGNIT